ncbi:hypothetical protein [Paraburkholderia sp. BL10I2N1]|uniref:hypothetical protein n=1 Tax=Paraburkholderia sp. BL10I2N1 TaxID=1938796 RepID=UPI0010614F10|nr:hypothetical protein [Paraburkholderia sp. BL10I2N1]TDN70457.1 hypothetical protein B0G77_3931 [Paraburkholderia sp. BL10I2N1]
MTAAEWSAALLVRARLAGMDENVIREWRWQLECDNWYEAQLQLELALLQLEEGGPDAFMVGV